MFVLTVKSCLKFSDLFSQKESLYQEIDDKSHFHGTQSIGMKLFSYKFL
jgi:hypothetical protein